ncbi:hypothetical protein SKAU_G00378270 [Synaphobranchus kaupii]|uniref:Protein-tyrosine phosphatase receptor IA-2 ectodomain domain-containing protein n=1 Tax=Synaphobranchus kaupii TaxID=118154 RepID=A0A9Q1ED50_SYNKA|nr:hypothetical protein SKAU_G00378270 [Synaphobranchus kaupii]
MSIMDSFHCILLAVFAIQANLIASADRKFGCLFEDELCTPYEVCANDGVFGRCQNVPMTEVYTYDVSPSTLMRLRTLLQKLSYRGLTWEDDAAQQAISKELSKLRRVSYSLPEPGLSRLPGPSDSGNRKLKMEEEAELSRSLKKYLQRLGLLPQAAPPAPPPGPRPNAKNDGVPAGRPLDLYSQPKAPVRGKTQGRGKELASQPDDGRLLLAALQQYLTRESEKSRKPAPYGNRPRPFLSSKAKSASPKEGLEGYRGWAPQTPALSDGTKPQRLGTDRLLFNPGSSQRPAKDPLSLVDEKFIQNVVSQLGKHDVNVDVLNGKELNQLADVIADALQVVDDDGGDVAGNSQRSSKRGPPSVTQPDQQGALKNNGALPEQQMREEKPISNNEDVGLVSKLLEYLDQNNFGEAQMEAGTGEEAGLGAGPAVGVENVKSRTTRKDLAVQKKDDAPSPDARQRKGGAPVLPVAVGVLAEPQKKDMHIEQELQLDVKAVSTAERDDDYGYIITNSDSLSTDQGVHLMEVLAHSVKLQMTDFLEFAAVTLGTESEASASSPAVSPTALFFPKSITLQRRCQKEIDEVLGEKEQASFEDRHMMPYTQAVIHEAQRLADTVPLSVFHAATKDTRLMGYDIPKGTVIIPNLSSVLNEESQWKFPHDFNPSNFLNDQGEFVKPEAFMPFSAGPRACLGEGLARMELFLILVTLLRRFKFFWPEDAGVPDYTPIFWCHSETPTLQTGC